MSSVQQHRELLAGGRFDLASKPSCDLLFQDDVVAGCIKISKLVYSEKRIAANEENFSKEKINTLFDCEN